MKRKITRRHRLLAFVIILLATPFLLLTLEEDLED